MSYAVFSVAADGKLSRMRPGAPRDEPEIQDLLSKYPEILAEIAGELTLVSAEQSVPDSLDGGSRWALDHLFVNREAMPVLVEVKRASDTRIRREVVGQLLDYAANGASFWSADLLAASFAKNSINPADNFFEGDQSRFWTQVEANLRSGLMYLVIVADEIPPELARVLEFLNQQMDAEVRGLELKWYDNEQGAKSLVPRIIGSSALVDAAKRPKAAQLPTISVEEWIAQRIAPQGANAVQAANTWLATVRSCGCIATISNSQRILMAQCRLASGRVKTLFWLSPGETSLSVRFARAYVNGAGRFQDPSTSQKVVQSLIDEFGTLSGNLDNVNGEPGFEAEMLLVPARAEAFKRILSDVVRHIMYQSTAAYEIQSESGEPSREDKDVNAGPRDHSKGNPR